jgi:hypothetical protein
MGNVVLFLTGNECGNVTVFDTELEKIMYHLGK